MTDDLQPDGTEQRPYTHNDEGVDRRRRHCRCQTCGIVAVCTPSFDFWDWADDKSGGLHCETCTKKHWAAQGTPVKSLAELFGGKRYVTIAFFDIGLIYKMDDLRARLPADFMGLFVMTGNDVELYCPIEESTDVREYVMTFTQRLLHDCIVPIGYGWRDSLSMN